MKVLGVAGAALLLWSAGAAAQTGAGESVLQSFSRCRAITAPEARLDCFDKAATALETAVRSKEVTIVDRQDVRKARRSLFGFTIPRLNIFGGGRDGDEEPEFQELNTTVVSASPLANGRMQLTLAEGDAVWATTDPMAFPPKPGAKIRIRKGALGNYFINISGERSVRGMRVR